MHVLDETDLKSIQVLINELVVTVDMKLKQNIAIELLDYLRNNLIKIEDWEVYNELCTLIEKKLNEGRHYATISGNTSST